MNPTQKIIIQTATELFFSKGIDQVTVREIALKANVNPALINYYFRSKDELMLYIVNYKTGLYWETLNNLMDNDRFSFTEKLEQYIFNFSKMLIKDEGMMIFLLSLFHSRPQIIFRSNLLKYLFDDSPVFKHCNNEIKDKKIKEFNVEMFSQLLLSMIVFPFSLTAADQNYQKLSAKEKEEYILSRARMTTEITLQFIEKYK